MIGEKLGDIGGKVIARRVLPSSPGGVKTESSQRGGGTNGGWFPSHVKAIGDRKLIGYVTRF